MAAPAVQEIAAPELPLQAAVPPQAQAASQGPSSAAAQLKKAQAAPVALTEPEPLPPPPLFAPPPVQVPANADQRGDFEPFAHEPPFRPRKNPTRRWTLAALGAGALMISGIGLMQLYGTPSLLSRVGIGNGALDTPLIFSTSQKPERRTLPNGNEFLMVSGQVINPTSEKQRVPDIVVELRNTVGVKIYEWVIPPASRSIAPKATMDFNGSAVDVPKGAHSLKLVFQGE